MYPEDYWFGNLWRNLYDEHFIPQNRITQNRDMGNILRNLIQELESVAKDLEKQDDIEADITLRFNGKVYSIEIRSVASAENPPDEDNTTDVSNENDSTGE